MRIGEITEFGEISFIDYEKCFVQFCEPGSKGVYGVFSMTFEEIDNHQINRTQNDLKVVGIGTYHLGKYGGFQQPRNHMRSDNLSFHSDSVPLPVN